MNARLAPSPVTRFSRPPHRMTLVSAVLFSAALLSGTAAFAVVPYTPPLNGLVAWWSADGNANDRTGAHNGTALDGLTYTAGPFGQAFSVGGSGRVFVPDSPAFQLTDGLTIGLWMKPTPDSWVAFCRGDTRTGLDPYAISMDRDHPGRVGLQLTDATSAYEFLTAPIAGYNVWQQVTATFDGATGTMRVYINGVLGAEATTTLKPLAALDPNYAPGIGIGNVEAYYNFPFQGAIDEVVLYSRALSPTEVASLVPEPSALSLLLCGGLWAGLAARRKQG